MRPAAREAPPPTGAPRASLRTNFAWTLVGNAVFGACQWAVLSLIAKLGSPEMLGEYALAVAVATPVAMFTHLNLRAVLATDAAARAGLGDYLAVRLATTLLGLAATAALAWAPGYPDGVDWIILLIGVALAADNLSDIFFGALQREERMDAIARSMMARGLLSTAGAAAGLWATGSIVTAATGLAAGRILVLAFHDLPHGTRGHDLSRTGGRTQWRLFLTALPLGVVLMLVSLTSNMPRYAIEVFRGPAELGVFAATAAFLAAGSTVVNALGQSATARLARLYGNADLGAYRRLAWKVTGVAAALGVAGVLAALAFGGPLLGLVYRPDYAAHAGLLATLMTSAIFVYVAVVLGYVITSARAFVSQMPLLVLVVVASAVANWLLVPRAGLAGAALAVAIAASVQIAGELFILRRVLRSARTPC